MKHFYENIQGWSNFLDLYKEAVERAPDNRESRFVEVGVWLGKSACFLGVEIYNSGKPITVSCVDTWAGSPVEMRETGQGNPFSEYFSTHGPDDAYNEFLKNIAPLREILVPIRKPSHLAAKDVEDKSLDFIFIDGDHGYDEVLQDINSWKPKIKTDGIMAGDDYMYPSVRRAVNEVFGSSSIQDCGYYWRIN